jgi:transcriptional regulator with XRE-family HTH domain
MSQADLASALGVSPSLIGDIEQRRTKDSKNPFPSVSLPFLHEVAAVTGFPKFGMVQNHQLAECV